VSFYPFIVLFYFLLLFIMHMFIVSILPAYKWLPPFAADVQIKLHMLYCTGIVNAMLVSVRELQNDREDNQQNVQPIVQGRERIAIARLVLFCPLANYLRKPTGHHYLKVYLERRGFKNLFCLSGGQSLPATNTLVHYTQTRGHRRLKISFIFIIEK